MKRTVTHEIKLNKSVKLILLAFAIAIFANAFQFSNPIKEASAVGKDIGQYQSSTTYRAAGNWVFVTIIDTTTGDIIAQKRYNGFKNYLKSGSK